MASPTMVVRRCPTCISLAMLGEEYSTTTVGGRAGRRHTQPGVIELRAGLPGDPVLAQPQVDEARAR